jgi:hypothetical protein
MIHTLITGGTATQCSQEDKCKDRSNVLHNEETHGNPAMESIDLFLVRKKLDNDDGAGKSHSHRNIQGADEGQIHDPCNNETEQNGKEYLSPAGCQGNRPDCSDQM